MQAALAWLLQRSRTFSYPGVHRRPSRENLAAAVVIFPKTSGRELSGIVSMKVELM